MLGTGLNDPAVSTFIDLLGVGRPQPVREEREGLGGIVVEKNLQGVALFHPEDGTEEAQVLVRPVAVQAFLEAGVFVAEVHQLLVHASDTVVACFEVLRLGVVAGPKKKKKSNLVKRLMARINKYCFILFALLIIA